MKRPSLVPPLKCQGIKTKLVPAIQGLVEGRPYSRWVEPFCGSCVVALNLQPKKALLCDSNPHIIRFYQELQAGRFRASEVKEFLAEEGFKLKSIGEPHYYAIRERFNATPTSLDFLFLNRSCFNGIIRFNRSGKFNVPYCHKPERFAAAYVTKIANQVRRIAQVLDSADWTFAVSDFRDTLKKTRPGDMIYADPPYAGRHADYFNNWSERDEDILASALGATQCDFVLSTWHSNEFRTNQAIEQIWNRDGFNILCREHFYHVGASENLRHPMIEAFVANFPLGEEEPKHIPHEQSTLFTY